MTDNELTTIERAHESGHALSRQDVLKLTTWSNAKLGRKMKSGDISFLKVPGKTAPTPLFNESEVLKVAGILQAQPEPVEIEPEPVKTAIVKAEKKTISKASQKNLGTFSNENFSEMFRNALVLPHKLYFTLKEASQLTGFPMTELHKFSELKFGRRVIKKSKLEKI